ncbi:hypothetical protein DNI29_23300 [Hymenobacter sediminis]|uniref:hypothetical protein n=1 Tax=Hymenobacter sediminis TaxID=2218621 RepID=UPI000DA6B0C1|nr:hypothetical protein [Hymenobacter sediminis]RPD43666.1 hypothetical protein DNI29_23300 [Hymenobacter sediminis]
MNTPFTLQLEHHQGATGLRLRGNCCSSAEATAFVEAIQHLIQAGTRILWLDCHQISNLAPAGQHAVLQIERLAAFHQLVVYWCGFSGRVIQQLSASGLYLLLRNLPASSYWAGSDNPA